MDTNTSALPPVVESAANANAPLVPVVGAAAVASPPQKSLGFLARLTGAAARVVALESENATLVSALASANEQLAGYQAIEADLEAAEAAAASSAATVVTATAAAAASAASAAAVVEAVPAQVAAQVADVVASLGVAPEVLPGVQTAPPAAGKAGEFSHLKGRERAVAAFNAQLAARR